jgi:hypothetical protein
MHRRSLLLAATAVAPGANPSAFQALPRLTAPTVSLCKPLMEVQNSGEGTPSLVIATNHCPVSESKALQLASSLLDSTGTGTDVTRDEMANLPVMRPSKTQFFRIHPRLHGDVNLLKVDGLNGTEIYAVVPGMVRDLDNVQLYTLFFGVHRDGSYFMWAISRHFRRWLVTLRPPDSHRCHATVVPAGTEPRDLDLHQACRSPLRGHAGMAR